MVCRKLSDDGRRPGPPSPSSGWLESQGQRPELKVQVGGGFRQLSSADFVIRLCFHISKRQFFFLRVTLQLLNQREYRLVVRQL